MDIRTPVANLASQLAEVVRLYFSSEEEIQIAHTVQDAETSQQHTVCAMYNGGQASCTEEMPVLGDAVLDKRNMQRASKLACYRALVELTGKEQPWGSLTGVRPAKLYIDTHQSGLDANAVFAQYGVSEEKIALCHDIMQTQQGVIDQIPTDGLGVYIGIPFCVSRCSYCSFPGRIAKKGEMRAYFDALLLEMQSAAQQAQNVYALYIGGGTPTSLDEDLFAELMQAVAQHFGNVPEVTLEAGRPDTITPRKLQAAKAAGVHRLCINPQSMVQQTLERIGRSHTPADIAEAFELARSMGFTHINMDIIAGLPGETVEQFEQTLQALEGLDPESVTCHTLAIKHGSRLNEKGAPPTDSEAIGCMVRMANESAARMGMHPYYMYRQKYMAGNLENTAFAKPGNECLYNIGMMDERSSILALGVGAISKQITGDTITRYANPKDLFLYIERIRAKGGMLHSI